MDKDLKRKSNPIALLPIGVFLVLYLGLGLVFEYALKIEMGFYNIPIVVDHVLVFHSIILLYHSLLCCVFVYISLYV